MNEISNESSNKKQRLGRGLGSLLGVPAMDVSMPVSTMKQGPSAENLMPEPGTKVWILAIEKLSPSKYQPRQSFNQESLAELAVSIKEHGVIQPILARKAERGQFEIIAGERRWRAAQLAGLLEVPVILKEITNKESLELGIIENLQREDLSPIDEAEAFQRLMQEFELTQQQVAERVGKDRATIANAIRLLQLPSETLELVRAGQISVGIAKLLLSVKEPQGLNALAKQAVTKKLTVKKIEKLIADLGVAKAAPSSIAQSAEEKSIQHLMEQLQRALGTRVGIDFQNGKGKISIHFYSKDELNEIYEKMSAAWQR